MKIAVITPVKHLPGIVELLNTKGEVFFLEEGSKEEVRSLLLKENIETILCNPNKQGYKIDEELLNGTAVSLINTCSTGMNHIDSLYCSYKGIKILSLTKDYELIKNLPSTAELAFGLLLSLYRKIPQSNLEVKNSHVWDYTPFVGNQIKDSFIGIVGYGRLGQMMSNYCKAFGAKTIIYDPYVTGISVHNISSLVGLFNMCDAVSLHVHVTDETRGMIKNSVLTGRVKYLVNTSRGEIVNEEHIVQALKDGRLLGYATDVLIDEFDDISNSPLLAKENLNLNTIITPHVGGMTIEGQTKAYKWAINKL